MSVKNKSESVSPAPAKTASRLPSHASQVIKRADSFEFEFNGKTYPAFAGDTIASALWAATAKLSASEAAGRAVD